MRTVFKTSYDADLGIFQNAAQAFLYLLLLGSVVALPWFISEFLVGEAVNVLIWALAGLGLMIFTGQAGQISLGHTAFLAVGCYANAILQKMGIPFLLALPLAGLLAGLAGVAIAIPALRLHGIYLAIFTLALAGLVEDIIVLAEPVTRGISGMDAPIITIFGATFDRYGNPIRFYYLVLSIVLIVTLSYRNMLRAPLGRAFAAVRDSELSAQAMGIDPVRTKTIAFGISCVVTGLAGALMGHLAGHFNHETFNIAIAIQLLLMIVVGGLGSIHGAFLGAIVIGFLPTLIALARDFIGKLSGEGAGAIPGLETAAFAAILIGFILFEPMGIYGRWTKIRMFFELFPFSRRGMFKRQNSYLRTERLR